MLINCEFETAMTTTDSLMKIDASEPLFPFLHLCAIGLRDLDFDRIIDTSAFLLSYQKAISTITTYEKKYGKTSYSMTLTGFAYASYASFYLLHKKYLSAVSNGLSSIRLFRDIKSIDSANADATFFLGFYTYAKSEIRKKLWMVFFWLPGNKKEGLRMLELCSQKAKITADAAKMVLVGIYIEEAAYEKARLLMEALFERFPESRFLLWSQAEYYEMLKKYAQAAEVYGKLSSRYSRINYGEYNTLITGLKQLEMLNKNGSGEEARLVARQLLKTTSDSRDNKRMAKLRQNIKQYTKD
jgi:tetratricopeptide (TPR) repeat protein